MSATISRGRQIAAVAVIAGIVVLFQNCSHGFNSNDGSVSNASSANGSSSASTSYNGDPTTERLIQQSDLQFLGGFRVPQATTGDPNNQGFAYGGHAITYDPARNGIYMVGMPYYQLVAEISIPALVNSTNLGSLNTATLVQDFTDVTDGHLSDIGASGAVCNTSGSDIGGLLVYNNELVGDVYGYYDAGGCAKLSHFTTSVNLSAPSAFHGMYQVGTMNPGWVAGYMTPIPTEWQNLLGGPVLTGLFGIPIISRSSYGPTASVFDPSQLGVASVVPATPVVGYTQAHETLGAWGNSTIADPLYDMSTSFGGIVFVNGSRSVLFIGKTGLGIPCYGVGTSDQSLAGTIVPGTTSEPYCYDPANSSKGTHAYPYTEFVWAYDANDLLAVKNGQKNMWDITPYAAWQLQLPVASAGHGVGGAAYDPSTQTIYISALKADPGGGYFAGPVVYAFKVQ